MLKEFEPRIEIFNPFKVPFTGAEDELLFSQRDLDACSACSACK